MNAIELINQFIPSPDCKTVEAVVEQSNQLDWTSPPSHPVGDDDIGGLFVAVGYALIIWEEMDARLGALFHLMQPNSTGKIEPYFYELKDDGTRRERNIPAKLDLLRRRLELFSDQPEFAICLAELSLQIRAASKRRNDIGHGAVRNMTLYSNGAASHKGIYLVSKRTTALHSER
jgi:hypothetical protein